MCQSGWPADNGAGCRSSALVGARRVWEDASMLLVHDVDLHPGVAPPVRMREVPLAEIPQLRPGKRLTWARGSDA